MTTVESEQTNSDQPFIKEGNDILTPRISDADNSGENSRLTCLQRWFSPIRAGSLRGGTISMVGGVFGTGCMTFPYAVSKVGLIPGILILLFVAISMSFTLKLVLDAGVTSGIFNYNKLAKQAIGRFWVTIYDIANIIIVCGTMMSYLITSYKLIIEFTLIVFHYDLEPYNYYVFLICCVCIQIPMCLLKNIASLQYFLLAGSISIMIVILIITCEAPLFYIQNTALGKNFKYFEPFNWNYLDTVAIFMYGYSNQNVMLQVMNELKSPTIKRGNKIIYRSFYMELVFYAMIGFGGYLSTFQETPEIFITRPDLKSFTPDYLIIVSKVIIAICLHCILPLKWNLLRDSAKSMMQIDEIPYKYDVIMTIGALIILNVCVYFVDIITIIGFIGGIFTVMISYFIPQFDYVYIKGNKTIMLCGYILLGIFTLVGFGASIKSVVYYVMQIK